MTRALATVLGAVISCVAACDNDEDVASYTAPKDTPAGVRETVAPEPPRTGAEAETIHWTLPDGWRRAAGSQQMRYATLEAGPADRRLAFGVFVFKDEAGGVLDNVNRWRDQMELAPIAESELKDHVTSTPMRDANAVLVRIQSADGTRMLAAIITRQDHTWFMKATGDDDVVAAHEAGFVELLESVHFASTTQTESVAMGASPSPGDVSWTTPDHWRQSPDPGPMLLAAFQVEDRGQTAQITVSSFPGDVGGLLPNINRWRRQVGLPQVTGAGEQAMNALTIDAAAGRLIDLSGRDGKRMLVAMVQWAGQTWFFKLTGPGTLLEREQEAFMTFLKSIRFGQPDA